MGGRVAKRKRKPRITAAEMTRRVDQVAELVLAGLSRSEILRYVSEKTDWGVSERTVDTYLARANEKLQAEGKRDRAAEFGKALARLETLYRKALTGNNYKTCLSIQKEIAQLMALHQQPETGITMDDIHVLMRALASVIQEHVEDPDTISAIAQGWAGIRESFANRHTSEIGPPKLLTGGQATGE